MAKTPPVPALALFLTQALVLAQRETPTFEFQKRSTTIEYGVVPVGKHTLDELEVGGTWRLGMNTASVWRSEVPIVAGERLLPPGEYRCHLRRIDAQRCAVVAAGSALAVGGGSEFEVEGTLDKAGKTAKKLDIAWQKGKAKSKTSQEASLQVRFGEHEWKGAMEVLGGETAKVGGYKLTVFAIPASFVEKRAKTPVPIAVLSKGKNKDMESWNLLLDENEARLVPWMAAPTEQFGFGSIEAPAAARSTSGKVEATALEADEPVETLDLTSSGLAKGELALELVVGKEKLAITVPEPPENPKK
ncbi:MAG: hypothetical protein KDE27_24110 [Planctomycetes bacterium]|nr:hypothetical protein [Planctomycetota bacterium]